MGSASQGGARGLTVTFKLTHYPRPVRLRAGVAVVVSAVAVDPRRLARSLYLECQREGPDVYRVTGGAEPHVVELGEDARCDCVDFQVHGGGCKHLLRVRLAWGDVEIIEALRLLVPYPSQRRDCTDPAHSVSST